MMTCAGLEERLKHLKAFKLLPEGSFKLWSLRDNGSHVLHWVVCGTKMDKAVQELET